VRVTALHAQVSQTDGRRRSEALKADGLAVGRPRVHFYNTERIPSAIGAMSPTQDEQQFLKAA